jgi:hypothetical protein
MALVLRSNVGMLLLGIWLVVQGITGFVPLSFPAPVLSLIALLAGVLILVGR